MREPHVRAPAGEAAGSTDERDAPGENERDELEAPRQREQRERDTSAAAEATVSRAGANRTA